MTSPSVPYHIAIIPDGNRRWAKEHGTSKTDGHGEGADTVMDIVCCARDLGVGVVTIYTFSTENWQRPRYEVATLMHLLKNYLTKQRQTMVDQGIRLNMIGDPTPLPKKVQTALAETIEATKHCDKIDMVLAINYGARDEIKRAFERLLDDIDQQKLKRLHVTEQTITSYLDTHPWPDPDLLIRTSGELRVSNFLLWQLSYAEIYTTDVLWPDFTPKHLEEAVHVYQERKRSKGA